MASTCNLIAVMMGKMVPLVGFILTILILAAGHIMTLLMNILGAFIHPARLQFVEFFPKFFKGGGTSFRPLREENKYITLVE
jgi:V/A-type H+-transporting ATPase subunit I